jgi:hypothetical protein
LIILILLKIDDDDAKPPCDNDGAQLIFLSGVLKIINDGVFILFFNDGDDVAGLIHGDVSLIMNLCDGLTIIDVSLIILIFVRFTFKLQLLLFT